MTAGSGFGGGFDDGLGMNGVLNDASDSAVEAGEKG